METSPQLIRLFILIDPNFYSTSPTLLTLDVDCLEFLIAKSMDEFNCINGKITELSILLRGP